MSFSKRLKQLRKEHQLTQEELAQKISKNRSTIAGYETERKEPDHETLILLADFFEVPLDYLLGRTDIRNIQKQTLKEKYPEIHDVEEAMKIILSQPGLMLKGELLTDESKIILANAIQMGLRTAEEISKKKNKRNNI
ncbi:putative transcriptional regulator [Gottschalkia purinilytica]|uniref:Putative transcriptional regulator n=1 Tax=Gottschalkia purinilytica TaxID=1503 RepID=A0A0L0WB27_GOTPU|nr:helix-turn-helix transcriptional regulator [Gottschalkia purinilytica]KNF08525.1 putative transcriptional regulator [Gottschalkia purinilytica]